MTIITIIICKHNNNYDAIASTTIVIIIKVTAAK